MRRYAVCIAALTSACAATPQSPVTSIAAGSTPAASMSAEDASADPVDLSGLWVISNRSVRGDLDEAFQPLAPEDYLNEAGLEAIATVRPAYDPSAQCLPSIPRQISGPYPVEIVQREGRVVQLFEWDSIFRIIYTDGREHPDAHEDQRFMGHAVGAWEGDTLVVDTANFNGEAWLNGRGVPMSTDAKMTEWYSLTEGGETLEVIARYEDPGYLKRPIWRKMLFNLKPDWAISEYICAHGNRDNVFQQQDGVLGSLKEDDVITRD